MGGLLSSIVNVDNNGTLLLLVDAVDGSTSSDDNSKNNGNDDDEFLDSVILGILSLFSNLSCILLHNDNLGCYGLSWFNVVNWDWENSCEIEDWGTEEGAS